MLGDVTTARDGGAPNSANDVTVTLPLPMMVRAGGRYRHQAAGRELFDVELDVEYETWSRANAFTVESNGLVATAGGGSQHVNIGTITVPKQWNDVLSVKLGGDFNLVPERWTLRAGGYYETAAAPSAYANVDFPAGAATGRSARRVAAAGPVGGGPHLPAAVSTELHRRGGGRPRLPADTRRLLQSSRRRSERL